MKIFKSLKIKIFSIVSVLVLIPFGSPVLASESSEWLALTAEYKDELLDLLEQGKAYSEEQLEIIRDCMNESSMDDTLECFSRGGFDDAKKIVENLFAELSGLRERICGDNSDENIYACDTIEKSLKRFSEKIESSWSDSIQKGAAFLRKANELFYLKKKICDRINEKGCWSWLNERIDLKCNPEHFEASPEELRQCRLAVANDVWERLDTGG